MQTEWVNQWEKSRNLSTHKNHATSLYTKSHNLFLKITEPLHQKKIIHLLTIFFLLFTKKTFVPIFFHYKNVFARKHFFTKKPLHTEIMQPLYKENQATSSPKKSRNLSTKSHTDSSQKNHATSIKINHKTWVSESVRKITQPLHTQKPCNLSIHKITQPLFF